MAEFLLEIFSEEIPARMQEKAAADLARLVTAKLIDAKLDHSAVSSYVTARRLTLHIGDLSAEQPDISEERRGPRADAPEKAIEGFLRGAGLTREQLVEREDKKGTFLYAVIDQKGRAASEIIAEFMPEIIRNFPWPKSQRWGDGSLRWVRPMHSILCILDGVIVDFELDGIKASNKTYGHRFMAPDEITVSSFADYQADLEKAFVVIDPTIRSEKIEKDAQALATKAGLEIVKDNALLNEVAGLAEYPVTLIGEFDKEFLDVPPEALTSAMRTHQKYFSLNDKNGTLANKFIFVSNMKTDDNGAKIVDGNERVLRARLSDTKFFWDQDLKSTLADHIPALDNIVFHAKLGSVGARVERLKSIAGYIAEVIGADPEKAKQAAMLSKSDLVTGMVDECPELQGLMGKYFALHEGLDTLVAGGIAEQYSPKGPGDNCPSVPVSIAVALAEKIDTLVGFFRINEMPTGSKDPFALRRAALGSIRLISENKLRFSLLKLFTHVDRDVLADVGKSNPHAAGKSVLTGEIGGVSQENSITALELRDFVFGRLQVHLKDKGIGHDTILAAFQVETDLDLVRLLARVDALQNFISTDDGENLLAGYKRAANILKAEEKKDGITHQGDVTVTLLELAEEKAIYKALSDALKKVSQDVKNENFEGAMSHLSSLRGPIDNFFDKVIVNSDEAEVRVNRLKLLSQIRATMNLVVDFSKIEG
ncbi:MAG: glycine--tRNA ligase subunit beta [Kordiimonadaceae bacterium]|jgi:glycyl-tRNA synthetase beta chain|nr:glycine--tRNA ligase subunit beta [Kordiimonadaceae bacterium]MBT6037200.1 glycine--tRNA ligase subunit beta [Kordiimonadaceae bacterium]MBT6328453.1 glycine--tRNA ligase subunit beta [Kordiimonadaceae bacterium]